MNHPIHVNSRISTEILQLCIEAFTMCSKCAMSTIIRNKWHKMRGARSDRPTGIPEDPLVGSGFATIMNLKDVV